MKKSISLFLFLITIVISPCYSQKSLQLGARLMNELTFFDGLAPGFGAQAVYRLTKHNGLESGIYYQSRRIGFIVETNTGGSTTIYNTQVAERRIQLPLLYRFDSKAINFVAGVAFDYFLGWKDRSHTDEVKIIDYNRDAFSFSLQAGISHSFYLSPTLILEPEAKFNLIVTDDDGGVGLNLSLRKIIF